jgi:hypothetical protein
MMTNRRLGLLGVPRNCRLAARSEVAFAGAPGCEAFGEAFAADGVAAFAAGGAVGRPSATVPPAADPDASESSERASEHETVFEMRMVMGSIHRGDEPRDV